jgi:alpha/beta superfamily hydrolase
VVLDAVTVGLPPLLTTSDGVSLEYVLDLPDDAIGSVVLCHPHPRHGGTMRAPILGAIALRCTAAGLAVLRFNFRGIGGSTGTYDHGLGELLDIDAAVEATTALDTPLRGISGWSFGAATALNWEATRGSHLTYVGIAPPVRGSLTPPLPDPADLAAARRTFIVGDRDQFVDADELEAYAAAIGAAIVRYETADHFFVFRHDRLADDVVDAILG